jgi:actin related protein 2/3 complex subunit 2
MVIRYRDEEAMYIQASHDRVTVIFSTVFREETDRIFGKVFLSEFVDARRRAIQNAPQVLYRNDPPLEIRGVPGVGDVHGDVGYITFVLFPRHLTRQRREESISHIQTFRDYFHYHIKAAKVRFCDGTSWGGIRFMANWGRHICTLECAGELPIS